MEPYFDESQDSLTVEEDREYRVRYEKRQRMRRERQRRMHKKRMIKRYLFLGVFVIGMVLIGAAIKSGRKPGAEEKLPKEQDTAAVKPPDGLKTEEITESLPEENPAEAEGTEETEDAGSQAEGVKYRFEEMSDTAVIDSEDVISTQAILVDESTDTVVAARGSRERIIPASMTKVLTILVAAEHIPEEKLDDTFTMTLEITDYAYVNDCSCVGFLDGEEVTVRDLFYGTAMQSGGDAALGLAVYVSGSQEDFVGLMNQKLEELGIAGSTNFTNCVGLYDEAHYSTVYDMAVIMKAAMQNDLCREFLSKHVYTTKPTREHPDGIEISNWFLRRIEDKDTGGEVLCAKTGYIVQSKNCAVSYGTFAGGAPFICVTAGSTSGWRCIYDHVEIYNRYVPSE